MICRLIINYSGSESPDRRKRQKLDLKGAEVSREKKAREEDNYDVPINTNKSEGEEKCIKGVFYNEENIGVYSGFNEDIEYVDITRGSILSSLEREGWEKVDDADKGSEVIIKDNINDHTSLNVCKGLTNWKIKKTVAESSPEIQNSGSEAKNDCEKNM